MLNVKKETIDESFGTENLKKYWKWCIPVVK